VIASPTLRTPATWLAESNRITSACRRWPSAAADTGVRAQIILLSPINARLPISVIVAAALSLSTVACAVPPKRVNPVGLSFAAYEDAGRRGWTGPQDRPLATAIWYPAAPGSRESEWRVGIFNAEWNAQKAPLSAGRIRSAFAIAPVLGPVMTRASLAEVKVPVRIIVGSKDDQAVPDVNARPIASAIPNAELEIVPNVMHYTFRARCSRLGKVIARSLCTDPDEIDREEVHRRVSTDALNFFNRTLRGERDGNEARK
jgi:pimeloyl-ACP methyl ester carboxylesterase